MTKEEFKKFKSEILTQDLFTGVCPINASVGGECTLFSWENCRSCSIMAYSEIPKEKES